MFEPENRRPRTGPRARSAAAFALLVLLAHAAPAAAQNGNGAAARESANWALANRFSSEALRQVVHSTSLQPRWLGETDSMWYQWRDDNGTRYELVAAAARRKQPLFDHQSLAEQLSMIGRKPRDANDLDLQLLSLSEDRRALLFLVDSVRYQWDRRAGALRSLGRWNRQQIQDEQRRLQQLQGGGGFGGGGGQPDFRNFSPDSSAFVFAREHNLYLVEVARGDTVQLTRDGVEHYSFGWRDTTSVQQQQDEDEQGQRQDRSRDPRVRANVTWSPDSRAFAVRRTDQRHVGELYLVNALSQPRPTLSRYRYAMPGEENVPIHELYIHRRGDSGLTAVPTARWKDQQLIDQHWTRGSDKLRFVRIDRLQRNLDLVEVDVPALDTRVVLSESVEDAFLEHRRDNQVARYLGTGGDFIWYSERTGWGHYYLYAHDGTLKNAITSGPWRADQVIAIDTARRAVYLGGVGRERGETNTSYRHHYRVGVDGSGLTLLDPGNATHSISLSPSKRFVVDSHSRIDMPTRVVLRDANGSELLELEHFDDARLRAMGWQPPEPFMVKADDGVTDIHGVMWKPFDFDPARQYPIIAHVYPGPQQESVTLNFSPTNNNQNLAQLGFIVIQIGNRGGMPQRSNAYHSFGYYNLRDYGLADKKAGIEQLAVRHPFIDVERVGIYGHSGGGFMTAAALLVEPYNTFFKVGVSSAGNHDNNVYNQSWSETHHGLRQAGEGDSVKFEIRIPPNHELAANLRGRLLLVHGDMDNNVHHAGTIRLADALIKENKRFDFMFLPGQAHGFGPMTNYFQRMLREYFAEHLIGDYYRGGAEMR